jgi:hypothetical protein
MTWRATPRSEREWMPGVTPESSWDDDEGRETHRERRGGTSPSVVRPEVPIAVFRCPDGIGGARDLPPLPARHERGQWVLVQSPVGPTHRPRGLRPIRCRHRAALEQSRAGRRAVHAVVHRYRLRAAPGCPPTSVVQHTGAHDLFGGGSVARESRATDRSPRRQVKLPQAVVPIPGVRGRVSAGLTHHHAIRLIRLLRERGGDGAIKSLSTRLDARLRRRCDWGDDRCLWCRYRHCKGARCGRRYW